MSGIARDGGARTTMTTSQLARHLGVSGQTIRNWARDHSIDPVGQRGEALVWPVTPFEAAAESMSDAAHGGRRPGAGRPRERVVGKPGAGRTAGVGGTAGVAGTLAAVAAAGGGEAGVGMDSDEKVRAIREKQQLDRLGQRLKNEILMNKLRQQRGELVDVDAARTILSPLPTRLALVVRQADQTLGPRVASALGLTPEDVPVLRDAIRGWANDQMTRVRDEMREAIGQEEAEDTLELGGDAAQDVGADGDADGGVDGGVEGGVDGGAA